MFLFIRRSTFCKVLVKKSLCGLAQTVILFNTLNCGGIVHLNVDTWFDPKP